MFVIQHRSGKEVNTDPQRRCYNGCHFSSEIQWDDWGRWEEHETEEEAKTRLKFWREWFTNGLNQFRLA